ncbi:mechanosensitive ion channel family protein [Membranicola marinus]|uniref:Mechanosensing system component YbdG n=1 Tax=Membranihabitans marinus TaxID=1227546 RepID=A0A953HXA4_9BACT|nr:mechanosensitive ion channel domain-containing protein [Membranihabitans marinus]MBY5959856.1 mechanosensitive ion channel family protein [Membranihabitans marinus]
MRTVPVIMEDFNDWMIDKIMDLGIPKWGADYVQLAILLIVLVIIIFIITPVVRSFLNRLLASWAKRTATKFDDFLIENKFIWYLTQLIPYIILSIFMPIILQGFKAWIPIMTIFLQVYGVLLSLWIIRAFLKALLDYARTKKSLHDKPLESYLQVIMIILYVMGGLLLFSILTGKSLWTFLTAMGAASAIILLVFKDSILGFVASIQVATNDMVRIGDWIQMDQYGADGTVNEITLSTVKVQNFDKTITTIPTYSLISDSFINWRGMQESGGRRIKRPIYIKISTIRHLTHEEVNELKKIQLLTSYIEKRQKEIEDFNAANAPDRDVLMNGRNLTNIGLFRKYIELYANHRPDINKEMTFMVRQLSPTANGLPLELYFFADTTQWTIYEAIMSDMFDHLLASIKYFHLEVFENPASDDLRSLREHFPSTSTTKSSS